jgi:electron transfer flavoprotein alpha subunit
MSKEIFAYIEHHDGVIDDSALELINAAKKIDESAKVTAIVFGTGDALNKACEEAAKTYSAVWKVDKAELSYPNAEIIRPMLVDLLPKGSICLIPHDTFGIDLGPGLAVKLDVAYLPDIIGIDKVEGDKLTAIRQEFSGQVHTHVECDIANGAVLTIRPGTFEADESKSASGEIVDKSADAKDVEAKRKFIEVKEAEVGDVDITQADILVSVGRGIGEEENIELAEELAEALGGVVSCSRPIVDAKWMDHSRQVGTSGKTVKPKVYIALGISGAFQHIAGIKGNPFIVAVNTNPKAPIFQVADVGVVEDVVEFLPVLTEKVKEIK